MISRRSTPSTDATSLSGAINPRPVANSLPLKRSLSVDLKLPSEFHQEIMPGPVAGSVATDEIMIVPDKELEDEIPSNSLLWPQEVRLNINVNANMY